MSDRRRSVSIPKELPLCEGPKLQLFRHHQLPIKWLERLDTDRDDEEATEGYVFRANIQGREYAIKVVSYSDTMNPRILNQTLTNLCIPKFKFFDPMCSAYYWRPLMGRDTPLNTAAYYTDPFYAECRAYGRIQQAVDQKKLRKNVAVPCHGFFFLQERDEKILSNRNIDFELNKVDLEYQQKTPGGCRIRAIVKDLGSPDTGVDQRSLVKILSGIATLNRNKIYVRDIRQDNYRGGQIVDFGSSWTEPHGLLDALDDRAAKGSRLADRVMFDAMVRDEDIPNPDSIRAMRNITYCKMLRSRT